MTRVALTTLVFMTVAVSISAAAEPPIEPLLQKYCLGCHNENDQEGGLSLQTPDSLKKGGDNGQVLNSENLTQSLLYQVLSKTADSTMPPEGEAQPTQKERAALRDWVLAGAKMKPMAAGKPLVPNIRPFTKTAPRILSLAVSTDQKTVAMGTSKTIVSRDAKTDQPNWEVVIGESVNQIAFAKHNPWILAATGLPGVTGAAVIVSSKDGSIIRKFSPHTDAVYSAVLNSAETVLATAGYDRRILIHDVRTGNVLQTLEGHNGSVFSLSFDPAGKILCSASADGTIKVWNVKSGQRLDTLSQPTAEQYCVAVGSTGSHIYGAGADNRIRVWDLLATDTTRINPLVISRFAHEHPITNLTFSSDGAMLASSAEDGTLSVWKSWPLQQIQTLPRQPAPVSAMAFLGNNQLLIAQMNGRLKRLNVVSNAPRPAKTAVIAHAPRAIESAAMNHITETEENNSADTAMAVNLPVTITGKVQPGSGNTQDSDCYEFSAAAGQKLLLEVRAARDKSPLDSRIEILTPDGKPVLRTRLQAVRDSYFTFRGKDSNNSNDFRVFNWQEMELNEYLYSDGEVVKLWLYPRGPDSGFMVYPGFGKRHTYFDTTPTSHALQAPCFSVVPRDPSENITPNGLPTFPIYFENDDDSRREIGSDSRLFFTNPADGRYVVRLTDSRGFGGADFVYKLTIRTPAPAFRVTANTDKLSMQGGTGREIVFTAKRIDGYNGPIIIDAANLPEGIGFSGPLTIQSEQLRAFGTVYAKTEAPQPTAEQIKAIKFLATADGFSDQPIGGLSELKIAGDPKLRAIVSKTAAESDETQQTPVLLTIRPGETISAFVKLDRRKHKGVVSFGKEDSGRNLPHGLYVDNIGLNGLLLLADQSEREFFITAAKWVPPSTSTFHLKSNVDGITSFPMTIQVLAEQAAPKPGATAAR